MHYVLYIASDYKNITGKDYIFLIFLQFILKFFLLIYFPEIGRGFPDFPGFPEIKKIHDFPDFPDFPDPVETLF